MAEQERSATKGTARKTAKKAPAKASSGNTRKRTQPSSRGPERLSGRRAAARGAQQLVELTGRELEGVVGLSSDGDGWSVQVEVVEMRRIPSTTDVLAIYEVDLDGAGDMQSYRRLARYLRGAAGEGR